MKQVPSGWARARLADVAEVRLGRQRSPKRATGDRMRPYLRAANVGWQGLKLDDVKEMDFSETESATYELRPGDLLLAEASGSAGEVGKPGQFRGEIAECCFQNTLIRVRLPEGLLPDFYEHFFRHEAMSRRFADGSRGVGIHHLGAAALSAWGTPIPPTAEQERIVAAIEEAFSLLDAGEAALHNTRARLKRMRESALGQAFESLSFDQECERVCSVIVDCPHSTANFTTEGLPCLDTTCMAPGRVLHARLRYVSPATWELRNKRLTPEGGDIVFAREGTIGTAVCLPEGFSPCLGQRVMLLRPGPSLLPRFLEQALMAPQVKGQYAPLIVGSTAPHLNVRDVKRLRVPVPALDEQTAILAELDRQYSFIDAAERAVDAALARSAGLRRSVLKAAFEGRLVEQDPADEPASVLLERIAAERATAPARRGPRRWRGKVVAS